MRKILAVGIFFSLLFSLALASSGGYTDNYNEFVVTNFASYSNLVASDNPNDYLGDFIPLFPQGDWKTYQPLIDKTTFLTYAKKQISTSFEIKSSSKGYGWHDCNLMDGGQATADAICKCEGYVGAALPNGCYYAYSSSFYSIGGTTSCPIEKGDYINDGAYVVNKIKCLDSKGTVSDYDKAVAIANWVTKSKAYDTSTTAQDTSLITAFGNTKGVCGDAAGINVAMLRIAGIPARMVYPLFGGHHVYTEAYVDGKWIGFDSTFSKDQVIILIDDPTAIVGTYNCEKLSAPITVIQSDTLPKYNRDKGDVWINTVDIKCVFGLVKRDRIKIFEERVAEYSGKDIRWSTIKYANLPDKQFWVGVKDLSLGNHPMSNYYSFEKPGEIEEMRLNLGRGSAFGPSSKIVVGGSFTARIPLPPGEYTFAYKDSSGKEIASAELTLDPGNEYILDTLSFTKSQSATQAEFNNLAVSIDSQIKNSCYSTCNSEIGYTSTHTLTTCSGAYPNTKPPFCPLINCYSECSNKEYTTTQKYKNCGGAYPHTEEPDCRTQITCYSNCIGEGYDAVFRYDSCDSDYPNTQPPTCKTTKSTSPAEVAVPFSVNAWGSKGWGDCSKMSGGQNAADNFCKCYGYEGAVKQNACHYAWSTKRYYLGTCSSGQMAKGRFKYGGSGVDKIKCEGISIAAAESTIRDADVVEETRKLAETQARQQAVTQSLSQAQTAPTTFKKYFSLRKDVSYRIRSSHKIKVISACTGCKGGDWAKFRIYNGRYWKYVGKIYVGRSKISQGYKITLNRVRRSGRYYYAYATVEEKAGFTPGLKPSIIDGAVEFFDTFLDGIFELTQPPGPTELTEEELIIETFFKEPERVYH